MPAARPAGEAPQSAQPQNLPVFTKVARHRTWAAGLALAPRTASASDSLSAMASYPCDPAPVTAAVIDHCLWISPALRGHYRHLLRDWQDRN